MEHRWKDDLARVVKMAADGLTMRQISIEFGVTRNAIAGVMFRNGIKLRRPGSPNAAAAPPQRRRRPKPPKQALEPTPEPPPPPPPPLPLIGPDVWTPSHSAPPPVELVDLESGHCRWPYDADGHVVYCGIERAPGEFSFCAEHLRAALTPRWKGA